jgi:hypothetical protein
MWFHHELDLTNISWVKIKIVQLECAKIFFLKDYDANCRVRDKDIP